MRAYLPWYDRSDRFSPLRLGVFIFAVAPAAWLLFAALSHRLGPRPDTEAIHQTGLWAIRLLAATLAVTPLRHAARLSRIVSVRRMLGLSVLAYALLHLLLYGVSLNGNLWRIGSEIVLRLYLTLGFVALCGLVALGVTSTDAMIRRLGARRWGLLHKSAYAIAGLGTVHFFMQQKLDVSEPIIMAGIFALLLGERLTRRILGGMGAPALLALALGAALATAGFEAGWYSYKTGAPMLTILAANLDFSYTVRPAWYVLGAGLVLVAARLSRPLFAARSRRAAAAFRPFAAE